MKKSHVHILKHWHKLDYYERNQKLKKDKSLLLFVLECLHNILNGVVAIDKNELKKFKRPVGDTSNSVIPTKQVDEMNSHDT